MAFTDHERNEFRRLVLPHLDALHRVALHLTHRAAEAEEIVAETIFKACQNFRRLRDQNRVKQWLLRILSNTFISSRRVKQRRQETSFQEEWENETKSVATFANLSQPLFPGQDNPEQLLIQKLTDEDIENAIKSLPEEYRVAIVLCDVEGFRYREIAHILRIPIGTVRSRLSRGRLLLQKKLWYYAPDAGLLPHRKQEPREEPCTCKSEETLQGQLVAAKP